MKINRRDFIVASSAAGILAKTGLPTFAAENNINDNLKFSVTDKKVSVYTTAKNTEMKMSASGSLEFKPMAQPLETQICVFVEPKRTFQTFMGIGGALTDASAETFAKIAERKTGRIFDGIFRQR